MVEAYLCVAVHKQADGVQEHPAVIWIDYHGAVSLQRRGALEGEFEAGKSQITQNPYAGSGCIFLGVRMFCMYHSIHRSYIHFLV